MHNSMKPNSEIQFENIAFELGKYFYDQKDYSAAIVAFTTALEKKTAADRHL